MKLTGGNKSHLYNNSVLMVKNDQKDISGLEKGLDSFNPATRKECLLSLVEMAEEGIIQLPNQKEIANLHCHTFLSYNGYGYSPSHIAWLGRKLGAKFMGIVDFDMLDGVDEFLEACQIVKICGSAGMETRVFIPEYSDKEINSPGEPGISYHMGIGFTKSSPPAQAADLLENIRKRSEERNRGMLNKINDYLHPLIVDYEGDVLPKTPDQNATERHMLAAIIEKSFSEIENPLQFWSEKLVIPLDEIDNLIRKKETFRSLVRKKLMKRGGVGYTQPTQNSFPLISEFHQVVITSGALPCAAWLDGTSEAEQDIENLLGLLIEKGAATINIIPDRNWNIPDPELKTKKLDNLYSVVSAAKNMYLPIIVGTEMNSYGQKLIDDFDTPELAPVKDAFIDGAYFIYGHTQMEKLWGMGWQSSWANEHFADRKSKNEFFRTAGHHIPPGKPKKDPVEAISNKMRPEAIINHLTQLQGKITK
jgi:hypothetical protein